MNKPTVTEAYAMIRVLKKRNEKGDAQKIEQLQQVIEEAKVSSAQLAIDKYFPDPPAPARGK